MTGGPSRYASIGGTTSRPLDVVKLVSFKIRDLEAVGSSPTIQTLSSISTTVSISACHAEDACPIQVCCSITLGHSVTG